MTESVEDPNDPIRLITLTTAAPVRIRDRQWPIIAHALKLEAGYSGAPHEESVWMKIRRNTEDGRRIVYGERIGASTYRGGELLAPEDAILPAIGRVSRFLAAPDEVTRELIDCLSVRP